MRFTEAALVVGLFCCAASPAAAQTATFDIPGGRLSDALNTLARQAGMTIGSSEPGLAAIRSREVKGRMPVRAALERLLAGSGYSFIFVQARTVRIVRAAPPRPVAPARPKPSPTPPPPPPPQAAPRADIIVTASKQGVSLDRFGGTARVLDLNPSEAGRFGERGSDQIVDRLAMLSSTDLGPGRNKIFIRGVADSSFNGPSQAIVGQYLGDVRLTYNAPDPDLQLYDVRRVEVLEGPQGTLYGTGSLGGIIRILPNLPDARDASAAVTGGVMATRHGDAGWDGSAMVNLPLVKEKLALRAVAYGITDGGYIDDVGRQRRDINSTTIYGGRAALQWTPGDDWRVEAGGTLQFISVRDGQYALSGLPPLSRISALPQPFDNDYRLGEVTVAKRWPGVELISATSFVRHDLESRFDATGSAGTSGPQLFVEDIGIKLISNETRLSQPDARGAGWVVGWSILRDVNTISRRIGPPDATVPITGVRNDATEAALFGQYSHSLTDRLVVTLGGRLTYSHSVGMPINGPRESEEAGRDDFQISPTAAITWQAGPGVLLYGHVQQGYRAGGLAISTNGPTPTAQRFESDSLTSVEAGVRIGRAADRFSGSAAISYAWWSDIQADLIDQRGLPYTANLGSGYIYGLEVEGAWRVTPRLRLDGSAFFNSSTLSKPAPQFAAATDRDLPNIAGAGGRIGFQYRVPLGPHANLSIEGAARYVGPSRLGIGTPIDIRQGDYVDARIGGRVDLGRIGVSLDVDNVADSRGNRFSFGNPFSIDQRNQVTPIRPRTIRFGVDAGF